MPILEILSAVSNLATAIGVGVAANQLRVTRRQSVTTFEDSLTVQYREVAATIPLTALLGEPLTTKEHEDHLKYFYRYFDLCNEQAFLHKNGRVSETTWEFWKDGILTNLRRPAFAAAWKEIAHRAKDDFNELRLLCPANAEHGHLNAAQSGKDRLLTGPPHTTRHAGPHRAVHEQEVPLALRRIRALSSTAHAH